MVDDVMVRTQMQEQEITLPERKEITLPERKPVEVEEGRLLLP
jgi:hypothetical protein